MKKYLLIFIIFLLNGCVVGKTITKETIDKVKCEKVSILLTKTTLNYPNSAGGVDVSIDYINLSDKAIKYAVFCVEPYNRVNDIQKCEITQESMSRLQSVGSVNPNGSSSCFWGNVWWNYSIVNWRLCAIEIEYMDGTKKIINRDLEKYELPYYYRKKEKEEVKPPYTFTLDGYDKEAGVIVLKINLWKNYKDRFKGIVATVNHGEKVKVIKREGDGVLIKTAQGKEGWITYYFIKELKEK